MPGDLNEAQIRPPLCQSEHEPQNQDRKEDALPGVSSDTKPRTAKISTRQSEEQNSVGGGAEDAPWLVQMVKAKKEAVYQPIRPWKGASHAWQQETTKQEFFS